MIPKFIYRLFPFLYCEIHGHKVAVISKAPDLEAYEKYRSKPRSKTTSTGMKHRLIHQRALKNGLTREMCVICNETIQYADGGNESLKTHPTCTAREVELSTFGKWGFRQTGENEFTWK
jgi:hypothetical protein